MVKIKIYLLNLQLDSRNRKEESGSACLYRTFVVSSNDSI